MSFIELTAILPDNRTHKELFNTDNILRLHSYSGGQTTTLMLLDGSAINVSEPYDLVKAKLNTVDVVK